MVDMSTRGAAFLTAPADAPAIGTRIELIEMLASDRLVREDSGPLPRFARVLRHDGPDGLTRRVAVRFETDADEPLRASQRHTVATSRARRRVAPPPPPAIEIGAMRRCVPADAAR